MMMSQIQLIALLGAISTRPSTMTMGDLLAAYFREGYDRDEIAKIEHFCRAVDIGVKIVENVGTSEFIVAALLNEVAFIVAEDHASTQILAKFLRDRLKI